MAPREIKKKRKTDGSQMGGNVFSSNIAHSSANSEASHRSRESVEIYIQWESREKERAREGERETENERERAKEKERESERENDKKKRNV